MLGQHGQHSVHPTLVGAMQALTAQHVPSQHIVSKEPMLSWRSVIADSSAGAGEFAEVWPKSGKCEFSSENFKS
ncbi:UNVERIFIED_CONTAM: hypothetical protein Sradi_0882000 [Sesamum radiatum]|uniref:Uncharacterized protein n=1 Tax=Sesamum radiatum TaxID=300843 RepID=A0AAW2V2Q4_SESRA